MGLWPELFNLDRCFVGFGQNHNPLRFVFSSLSVCAMQPGDQAAETAGSRLGARTKEEKRSQKPMDDEGRVGDQRRVKGFDECWFSNIVS